ncbi:hypothetical protein PI126_g9121 [Phytophthora idaei]|nr:hypothetical protein PI126_g9121 [Phytophthora idaei]
MRTPNVFKPLRDLFQANKFVLEESIFGGALEEIAIVAILREGVVEMQVCDSGAELRPLYARRRESERTVRNTEERVLYLESRFVRKRRSGPSGTLATEWSEDDGQDGDHKYGQPVDWRGQSWVYHKDMVMIAFEEKDVLDYATRVKTVADAKDQAKFNMIQAKIKKTIMASRVAQTPY